MEIKDIELKEIDAAPNSGEKLDPSHKILSDLSVSLDAVIGSCRLSVKDLYALKKGQLLTLEEKAEEPIKLYYKDELIALGELVATGEHFGIKVTQVANKT